MDTYITHFEQWRAERPITGSLLIDYRRHLDHKLPARSSRNRYVQSLKPWLQQLRIEGKLGMTKDEIGDSLKRWKEDKHPPEVLTCYQVAALVRCACECEPNMARFVLIALTLGARPGEVVALKGSDFRPPDIRIWSPKTREERLAPMDFSSTLQSVAKRVSGDGRLMTFHTQRGHPSFDSWKALAKRADIPDLEPRGLRRTCRSFAASSGQVPSPALRAWFGHSEAIAAKHYENWRGKRAGNTIEQWYDCADLFAKLLDHAFPVAASPAQPAQQSA